MSDEGTTTMKPPTREPRRMIIAPSPGFPRCGHLTMEVGGPLGVLLFQRANDVHLWAACDEDDPGLFQPPAAGRVEWMANAASAESEIAASLSTLARLTVLPAHVSPPDVTGACLTIAAWAEERAYLSTALDFLEAAAVLAPDDAAISIRCGRVSRSLALPYRASQWFLRAIDQARRGEQPEIYIQGHLGYGILLFNLGHYAQAKPHFIRAAKTAARNKKWGQAGEAYHDLLTLSTDAGTLEEGDSFARRALKLYPVRYRRVPHLVYDYAYALVKRGHFSAAHPLLTAVIRYFVAPEHRMLCNAVFARTCAALGLRDSYDTSIGIVLQISAQTDQNAAASLLHAAAAARTARDWDLAERLSATALDIAIRRAEGGVHEAVLALMDEIAVRDGRDRDRSVPDPERTELTARLLLARLGKQRAPE